MTLATFLIATLSLAAGLSAAMSVAWAVRRATGNSGWVDVVWTFGLGSVGVLGALLAWPGDVAAPWRQLVVAGLLALWAIRLGTHIARRTRAIDDDPRYAKLAHEWGADASWRMFELLQKQALVSIPMAAAVFLAAHNPVPEFRLLDAAAVFVALVAIVGEMIADRQLRRFAAQGHGKDAVCDVGLWRYSRHPNYFFEWLGWVAYPLFAIDLTGAYPWGWLALAGPACMYWLLRHVSGVPPLEEHMLSSRGDAYRRYQQRTSAFFPMPAKSSA
jgi:steroid 5-alpha reductase family enzyme